MASVTNDFFFLDMHLIDVPTFWLARRHSPPITNRHARHPIFRSPTAQSPAFTPPILSMAKLIMHRHVSIQSFYSISILAITYPVH